MEDLSACMIDTRVVYGFPGAGKTYYIRDCIRNDYFYKYGRTLILCFEQGKEVYDENALRERNTVIAYYGEETDIRRFCRDRIEKYGPDRIYVEMNAALPALRNRFPENMNVTSEVTMIEWETMDRYLADDVQALSQMVSRSHQITFRGCPSKELLAPYSQEFKLMNNKASYLRQDPMGYHEKAFDLFVPYSLESESITINAGNYLVFWLDASEHPEHYDGKHLLFTDPLELRRLSGGSTWNAGRVVMTCCMSDLQFMSFELSGQTPSGALRCPAENEKASLTFQEGWVTLEAEGKTGADEYGRRVLKLIPETVKGAASPGSGIILQAKRRQNLNSRGSAADLAQGLFRKLSERHS